MERNCEYYINGYCDICPTPYEIKCEELKACIKKESEEDSEIS